MLAARYRLVALLGRGGMGEVYRAEDLKLGQTVALKFLPESLASRPDRLSRLFGEVRTARLVTHPNVCRVHDVGEVDGLHYISMEYVDGEDLASLLRRVGHVPKERALSMARQLCAGLSAAHDRGIVHRDLKPANVMVDGNGRIRIHDFGLAGLAEEMAADGSNAGTPAYMAPEQLLGQPASVKSDIYGLGLVLYELFTGERAFVASSRDELMKLHAESTPSSPSSLVDGFDPSVERVILRCLARAASRRPDSVRAVAAALPGGDPLAAALAAGETPSPETVARAGEQGALRPTRSLLFLSLILAGMLANGAVVHWSDLPGGLKLPLDPADLAARAKEVIRMAGYDSHPADSVSGLRFDFEHVEDTRRNDSGQDRWARLAASVPSVVQYWYRESPAYLVPVSDSSSLSWGNPPQLKPGMISIRLDSEGRLLEFDRVPEADGTPAGGSRADWSRLVEAADLDATSLVDRQPAWRFNIECDDRAAWSGKYRGRQDSPVRVEACSVGGKPASFRVVSPWMEAGLRQEQTAPPGLNAFIWLVMGVLVFLICAAALLARRNVRSGRGDRPGALKLCLFVFGAELAGSLLGYHFVPDPDALPGLWTIIAKAVLAAMMLWLIYLALEPYARKLWPEMLISWNRVLAGRFRDPMVGRDILVGAMFGFLIALVSHAGRFLLAWLGAPDPAPLLSPGLDGLMGESRAASFVLETLIGSLMVPAMLLLSLVLLRSLTRRQWVAGGCLVAVLALFNSVGVGLSQGGGDLPKTLVLLALVAAVAVALRVYLLIRFGLLAAIASVYLPLLCWTFPITRGFQGWSGGPFVAANLLVVALSVYAFVIAKAGEPLLSRDLIKE